MKITDGGFSVTDLNIPDLEGISVTYGDAGTTVSILEEGATPMVFTLEQWREFTAAVAAVSERLNDSPAAPPSDTRAVIIDGDGDKWHPVPNTDLYTYDGMEQTREWIKSTYGIHEG